MERTTLSAASLQELQHEAFTKAANGQFASGLVFFTRVMSFAIGALLVCASLFYLQANNADLGQGHSLECPLRHEHRHTTLTESFEFPLSSPQQAPPNPSLRYNMPSLHSSISQPADVTILETHFTETKSASTGFMPSHMLVVPTHAHAELEPEASHGPLVAYKVMFAIVITYVILFYCLRYMRGGSAAVEGQVDILNMPFLHKSSRMEGHYAGELPLCSNAATVTTTSIGRLEASKSLVKHENAKDVTHSSSGCPNAQVSVSRAIVGNESARVANSLAVFDSTARVGELVVHEEAAATILSLPIEQPIQSVFSKDATFTSAQQSCMLLTDAESPISQATSKLQFAALHSAAASRGKPPGMLDSSLHRFSSPARMAMDMLTPMRTPSPFPGFPPLIENRCRTGVLEAADIVDNSEYKTVSQRKSNSTNSWGSSAAGSNRGRNPRPSHGSSFGASPTSLNKSIGIVDPNEIVTPIDLDPCAADVIYCLDHFDEDGEELQAAQSVNLDAKSNTPCSKFGPRNNPADDNKTLKAPKWLQLGNLPDASTPSYPEGRCSDILRLSDLSASRSCTSGADIHSFVTPMQPITIPPDNLEHTPAIAAEAYLIADELASQARGTTSEDGSNAYRHGGRVFQSGGPWSSFTEDQYAGNTRTEHLSGLLKPRQEPGRDYAAAAAAASVLVASIKQHAKALQLAAYAGDNQQLRSVQRELHATVSQLLAADLTPQAYTANAGACKALAFTPAATPGKTAHIAVNNHGASPTGQSVGDFRVASIGSRVASGDGGSILTFSPMSNADAPPSEEEESSSAESVSLGPTLRPSSPSTSMGMKNTFEPCKAAFNFQPGVRSADPRACPTSSVGRSSPMYEKPADGSDWSCGPKPLPRDVDAYLTTRDPVVSPLGHIVASLKSAVAFLDFATSNLINELARKNNAPRASKTAMGECDDGGACSMFVPEETHPAAASVGYSKKCDTLRKRHSAASIPALYKNIEPATGTRTDDFEIAAGEGTYGPKAAKRPAFAAETSLNSSVGAVDATTAVAEELSGSAVHRQHVDRSRGVLVRRFRRRLTARTREPQDRVLGLDPQAATGAAAASVFSPSLPPATNGVAMFQDVKRDPFFPGLSAAEPHAMGLPLHEIIAANLSEAEIFSPISVHNAEITNMGRYAAPSLHTCRGASTPSAICRTGDFAPTAVTASHNTLAASGAHAQAKALPVLLGDDGPGFFTFPVLDTLRNADGLDSSPAPETPQSSSASCGGCETENKVESEFMARAVCPSNTARSIVGRKNVSSGVAAAETPASHPNH